MAQCLSRHFQSLFGSHRSVLAEVVVEYLVGHKRRRAEGTPLLIEKYQKNLARIFDTNQKEKIEELSLDFQRLTATRVDVIMDLLTNGYSS